MRAVLIFLLVAAVLIYSMLEVDAHGKWGNSHHGGKGGCGKTGKGECAKCASPKHAGSHFCTVDCTVAGGDDPPPPPPPADPPVGTTPS